MEAITALGAVWFISKRIFNFSTSPLPVATSTHNGEQVENKVIVEEVKRNYNTEFHDLIGDIDVNRPINADDELKDVFYPAFARNELVKPRYINYDFSDWSGYLPY